MSAGQIIEMIAPQTDAATSRAQTINSGRDAGAVQRIHIEDTIFATGLGNGETVDLQVVAPDGSTADLYVDGTQAQLTDVNTIYTVRGCCTIRVTKASTSGAVGVWLQRA